MPKGAHLIGKGGPGRPKGCKNKPKKRKKKKLKKLVSMLTPEEFLASLPPATGKDLLTESEVRIAKCCATCKHFMPIGSATGYHRGFCTFGHKDALRSGIRIRYELGHAIKGSLVDILPKLKEHYPTVHEHFVCDDYVKETSPRRLRQMLIVYRALQQEKIIFESDLEI